MHPLMLRLVLPLAQAIPWDDAAEAPSAPQTASSRRMSFSDLQQGLRNYSSSTDNSFRNGILILMAVIAAIVLAIHLYQRRKNVGTVDSLGRLGWELGGLVRFPFGSRLMLWWVARSTDVPFASLLLSSALFDQCVSQWAARPTMTVARHWGRTRLASLRPGLFQEQTAAAVS